MTRTGSGGFNTAIRIPPPLLERIDDFAHKLQAAVPGSEVTRSEAIRILVTKGLDAVTDADCKVNPSKVSP